MAWTERGDANRKRYIKYYRELESQVPKAWKKGVLSVTINDNSAEAATELASRTPGDPERATSV
jgi:hypothetical protein